MNKSKSGIFLIELTISIFFFTLASVVCIQIFVSSFKLNKENLEQNNTMIWVQNIAETYYACDGNVNDMILLLSQLDPLLSEYMIISIDDDITTLQLEFNDSFELSNDNKTYIIDLAISLLSNDNKEASLNVYYVDAESETLLTSLTLFAHSSISLKDTEVYLDE